MTTQAAFARGRRAPGLTLIALVSLAFGIGLNLLIFAFTSPVLFKGLPYPDTDRLLDVSMAPPGKPETRGPITPALYVLLRDKTSAAFEAIGVFDQGRTANLAGDATGSAERLAGHRISATGLAALGAAPLHGRLPSAADEAPGAAPTIVLGYPLWEKRFGSRPDVVEQTVNVDGQATKVLGVMPEGFGLLDNSSDAWFTSGFEAAPGQEFQHNLRAVGRLKPGVSMEQAQAAVNAALGEYATANPNRDKGWTVELTAWREARYGGLQRPLAYVQLGVGAMLLLLAINVGVLLGARPSRGSKFASSLKLALGAGAIGAVITALGLPALREITPRALPRLDDATFDVGVVIFALLLSVVTAVVIALVPARASRSSAVAGSGSGLLGGLGAAVFVVLLAVQMVLAFVLLTGAGLAMRAVNDLQSRDIGIDPAGLLSFDVHLPRSPYVTPDVARVGSIEIAEYSPAGPALYDRVRAALQTMPGVVQAAGVGTQPFAAAPFVQCFVGDVEHTPDNQVTAQYLSVTENYFNTMGIRLISGRDFAATDPADSSWVVLVNETFARQQWPDGGNPIGQHLTLTFHPDDAEPARQVIGVVADTLPFRGASEVTPLIYLLHRQQSSQQRASLEGRRTVMSFIVKASGDPLALGDDVRALVGKVDITTPVTAIRTVESYLNNAGQTAIFQYAEMLLGIFAIVALVIGVAGVYALSAYGAARGWPTIGVAIGVIAAVGIGIGVGRYVWLRAADVLASFLTNLTITPSDGTMLATVGAIVVVAALVAFLVPRLGAVSETV